MSAGTDMSAKNADTTLDNAAHGGCPATTCYASSCGRVTLYHGRWQDILPLPVDAIITDQPYGTGWTRGVEIYGRQDDRHSGLRWENIDWTRKTILVTRDSAKQTSASRARLIPMPAALVDWLSPWRHASGPVYSPLLLEPSKGKNPVTGRLGKLIGGWKANALRASRASYRLAQTQSIATVTLEMGHSKDMLIGTYLNPRLEDDAETWFSLDRDAALQLASSSPSIVSISA